jgi:hypothetical protein
MAGEWSATPDRPSVACLPLPCALDKTVLRALEPFSFAFLETPVSYLVEVSLSGIAPAALRGPPRADNTHLPQPV